jgi:hypothetical protein
VARGRTPILFDDCGGAGCAITRPAGARVHTPPGFSYSTQAKPCASAGRPKEAGKKTRKTCPVQLIFDRGQPKLRFCLAQGRPGKVIAVSSAEEAQRVAGEACRCWARNRKQFGQCLPADAPLGSWRRR